MKNFIKQRDIIVSKMYDLPSDFPKNYTEKIQQSSNYKEMWELFRSNFTKLCLYEIINKDIPIPESFSFNDEEAYQYCRLIDDIPRAYNSIHSSNYATFYCHDVKVRPEIKNKISTESDIVFFLTEVHFDELLYSKLNDKSKVDSFYKQCDKRGFKYQDAIKRGWITNE